MIHASKKHLLFICSRNKLRSLTAEAIFSNHPNVEVESAGLNKDAVTPLCEEHLDWADVILVMEKDHLQRLKRNYASSLKGKKVVTLNIPDNYAYMDPQLVSLLKSRCAAYLGA